MAENDQTKTSASGIFDDHSQANLAVNALQTAHFTAIQLITGDNGLTVLVNAENQQRQQEARDILHQHGAMDSTSNPASSTANTQENATGTPSTHTEYDPIHGPEQVPNSTAPVDESGYGLQRDPSVETQAEAKTYYQGKISDQAAIDGSSDSAFERPIIPENTKPGGWNDPNDPRPHAP